ncbi:MAG: hypothetical protein A2X94_13995 [Bdellovibrionales bacterium GWB1_55_8]|nr:MAG: hypothetical protein A2X94_13995 [Bdellovibrionales bacterium GWB1_55_8]
MSNRTRILYVVLVASLGFSAGSGCQRSSLRQDPHFSKDSSASYYADNSGQTPAQRIESLGQPKKRVVVLDFWNDTPVLHEDMGRFAADELRRGLFVTERLMLPTDVSAKTSDYVQANSKIKVDQLIREGRRMGVAVMILGRVTKVVFRQRGDEVGLLRQRQSLAGVEVEVKAFDVAAGREIMATAKSGEASSNAIVAFESSNLASKEYRGELTKLAIREAVAPLVPDVLRSIEKLAWEGRVAKVAGPRVYVNAGKTSGLIAGDILKVLSSGEDIFDPATGAFLGRTQGQLKGTLEVMDFLGSDGAITEIHSGANFQEGDTVQLY